jgi:hypothetical protein
MPSVERRYSLSTVLENCTEATSAAYSISGRLIKTGITGPLAIILIRICLFLGVRRITIGLITVKIVRAHGGCLGTKSR